MMSSLKQEVSGALEPLQLRDAYRHWTEAPRSKKRRDRVYHLALPLVGLASNRIHISNHADREDLIQTLGMQLYETLFTYLPTRPALLTDLVARTNGELSSYLGNVLNTRSQDWLSQFKRWRDETFDFTWACVNPPHSVVGDPRSDVLPRLYREEVRSWAFGYTRQKNRLSGKLREASELAINYMERGLTVPDFQLRQRRLTAQQRRFVVDYVLVLHRLGVEELLTREVEEARHEAV